MTKSHAVVPENRPGLLGLKIELELFRLSERIDGLAKEGRTLPARLYPDQSKTFQTKTEAQDWAKAIETDINRGSWRDRSSADSTTLYSLLDRYLKDVVPSKRGKDIEELRINLSFARAGPPRQQEVLFFPGAGDRDLRVHPDAVQGFPLTHLCLDLASILPHLAALLVYLLEGRGCDEVGPGGGARAGA